MCNLPLGRISSFHNLPQNSGNFGSRDISNCATYRSTPMVLHGRLNLNEMVLFVLLKLDSIMRR